MDNTPIPASKEAFMAAYRKALAERFEWARDKDKLDRFMESVRSTLMTDVNSWDWRAGTAATVARRMGLSGKLTLKALRALPTLTPVAGTGQDSERDSYKGLES